METRDYMEEIRRIIMFNDKDFYPLFYDIVYNNFIDRVKNRLKLTTNEFYEIVEDMAKKLFPYLPVFMIETIIENHGWKYDCEIVGEKFWGGYKLVKQ